MGSSDPTQHLGVIMAYQNVLRQIRKIVYKLKRQFGLEMFIGYRDSADVYNLRTGKVTRNLEYIKIKRGIVLPQRSFKDFEYDLSFIAANKNFTYGGLFEPGTRNIIIDVKDLPDDFVITTEMYVVFEGRRYEIKAATIAEHNKAWLINAKQVSNTDDVDPEA